MATRWIVVFLLPLVSGCPDSTAGEPDARARMPADLGDISGRGCATGTVDLRSIEDDIDSFRPFCAAETLDCVLGCADDADCEADCVQADDTAVISLAPQLDLSGCASCFAFQRNACVTAACPVESAELTCCIEDHPECATDRGCGACGERWDRFTACRGAAECLPFQEWCFVAP